MIERRRRFITSSYSVFFAFKTKLNLSVKLFLAWKSFLLTVHVSNKHANYFEKLTGARTVFLPLINILSAVLERKNNLIYHRSTFAPYTILKKIGSHFIHENFSSHDPQKFTSAVPGRKKEVFTADFRVSFFDLEISAVENP